MKLRTPIVAFLLIASSASADTASSVAADGQAAIDRGDFPAWWNPAIPEDVEGQIASKAEGLVGRLDLQGDVGAEVSGLVRQHYSRVWAWHQEVDGKLDAAWAAWDEARSNVDGKEKDELKALAVMAEQIDPIYAEFAPQIRGFLAAMRGAVGDEKATELLDIVTRSPGAERTYRAYLEMVPEMREYEKAVIWGRLAQAREDSLAAWSDKRIVKIFKKYKVRNEFSIDYFGYGYRERYQAWVERKRTSE